MRVIQEARHSREGGNPGGVADDLEKDPCFDKSAATHKQKLMYSQRV
jgi:hypothetical protein